MSGIKFEIGGRSVSQSEFLRNMENSALEQAHKGVRSRVLAVRCPVHGRAPDNFRVVGTGSNLKYEYAVCCERLKEAVAKALR
jgi:hypothetical protein